MHKRHRAARWYAKRGWRVFPCWPLRDGACACGVPDCGSAGKHPVELVVGNWKQSATTDLDRIDYWWGKVPDANVATCSWLRVDVDTKHDGKAHWRDLVESNDRLNTVHCMTPSGGDHFYFKPPDGLSIGNGTGDLPTGIDVRGHNSGYTLLPPSNHVHGTYEWELSGRPDEVAISDAPDWLIELLMTDEATLSDVSFADDLPSPSLDTWDLSQLVEACILADRSRVDQAIITALVFAGASDDEIRAVFRHYDTTGKYAEKGRTRDKYLAHSIAKARSYAARQTQPSAEPGPQKNMKRVNRAWKRNRVT